MPATVLETRSPRTGKLHKQPGVTQPGAVTDEAEAITAAAAPKPAAKPKAEPAPKPAKPTFPSVEAIMAQLAKVDAALGEASAENAAEYDALRIALGNWGRKVYAATRPFSGK